MTYISSAKPVFSLEVSRDLWSLSAVKETVNFLQRSPEVSGIRYLAPEMSQMNGFSPVKIQVLLMFIGLNSDE